MPTPSPFVWKTASGQTVDQGFLAEWDPSTVSAGGGSAPTGVAITSPSADTNILTDQPVTISGTATGATDVKLYNGAALVGTATIAGNTWSYTFTPSTDGAKALKATATNANGSTDSAVRTLTAVAPIFTTFEEAGAVIGQPVIDWSYPWKTSATYTYVDLGADGFGMRMDSPDGGDNAAMYDAAGTIADGEVLALMGFANAFPTTAKQRAGPVVRASGALATETGMFVLFRQTGADASTRVIHIEKNLANVKSTIAQPAFAYDETKAYWFRLRFQGSSYKLRVWERLTAEPSAWTHEWTDADLTSGTVGMLAGISSAVQHNVYKFAAHAGVGTLPL